MINFNNLKIRIILVLEAVLYHLFIISLWPLLLALYMIFFVYRKLIGTIIMIRAGERYGGLVETADAVYLIKDINKFTITSVLIAKCCGQRNMFELMKSRLQNKVFDVPHKYPKLTSGQYEYGGYAYWIKNDYHVEDAIRLVDLSSETTLNENTLKHAIADIITEKFPKDDRGLWEILVSARPMDGYQQSGHYYYPIITRFSHAIADGTSLIALLIDLVGDDSVKNYSEDLFRKMSSTKPTLRKFSHIVGRTRQGFKLFLYATSTGLGKSFKFSQLRKADENALHGPSHNGRKIVVWRAENKEELIPIIKKVKNKMPGIKFSYVILTAISSSLTKFFERNGQPLPSTTTSLITVLLHFPKTNNPKSAKLQNKTSVAVIDLPILESGSLTERLLKVKGKMEETQYGDVLVNYFILTKVAGIFPLNIASKIISRGTYTNFITNVPGGSSIEIFDGCVLDTIVPFAPNMNNVALTSNAKVQIYKMEEYSNANILNLFYIHGECYKVLERTCRVFNERHPHLQPMNKTKFKRIETNFLRLEKVKVTFYGPS